MRYTVERLCADVMERLGETARPPLAPEGSDVPSPEDIVAMKVRSHLSEAGGKLISDAPAELLEGGAVISGLPAMRLMPCGLYGAEVRLPVGFLRLVSVRMSGWRRSVVEAVAAESPEWGRQWSAEAGIAGCPEAPMAYLYSDADGLLLRLLGCGEDDSLEWLAGWMRPEADGDGEFGFPGALYADLVSAISGRLI